MNLRERKNLIFRLVSGVLLLLSIGLMIFSLITIFNSTSEDKILALVACGLAVVFAIVEIFIVVKGWKKELSLYKVAFNTNGTINNVFTIAIGLATLLGLALTITSLVLYLMNRVEPFTTSCLVILSIGAFLLINCIIYFFFVILFRKHELTLKDYAK